MVNIKISTGTNHQTLGIKVSRRALGYAILKGTDLQLFGVRGLHRRALSHRQTDAVTFIETLLEGFHVSTVVLDSENPLRDTSDNQLDAVRASLISMIRRRGLTVRSYPGPTVGRLVLSDDSAPKGRIAATIVEWFPYLGRYLRTDLRTGKVYWRKMLDAVALAWAAGEERQRASVLRALRRHNQGLRDL